MATLKELDNRMDSLEEKLHSLEVFIVKGLTEATAITKVLENRLCTMADNVKQLRNAVYGVSSAVIIAILVDRLLH